MDSPTVFNVNQWQGRVALVTGATSGIGRAAAIRLFQHGLKVVGIGRRQERLDELQNQFQNGPGEMYTKQCDVREENQLAEVFRFIKDKFGGLDLLINNAGVIRKGGLMDGEVADWAETLNTNVLALCAATKMAIPLMKNRFDVCQIINVNSVAGHSVPQVLEGALNIFPGSKFAVRAICETLRLELAAKREFIKVTDLTPGYVKTEILKPQQLEPAFKEIFSRIIGLTPDEVADGIIYVLSTPAHVNIQELVIHAMHTTEENKYLVPELVKREKEEKEAKEKAEKLQKEREALEAQGICWCLDARKARLLEEAKKKEEASPAGENGGNTGGGEEDEGNVEQ